MKRGSESKATEQTLSERGGEFFSHSDAAMGDVGWAAAAAAAAC